MQMDIFPGLLNPQCMAEQENIEIAFVFSIGAFPVSPAVYGGPLAPILFESLDCELFSGSEDGGPLEGELPDRLIDCRFGSFALTPVASPPRLAGVQCDGECVLLIVIFSTGFWTK